MFTQRFVLFQKCYSRRADRHRKALDDGMRKVEDSLDVVKLVRDSRALNTLLRLLLSKEERSLIRFQRKYNRVLDDSNKTSDEDIGKVYEVINRHNLNYNTEDHELSMM